MGLQWDFHEINVFPWKFDDACMGGDSVGDAGMGLARHFHRTSKALPWEFQNAVMLLWDSQGTYVFSWDFHIIAYLFPL